MNPYVRTTSRCAVVLLFACIGAATPGVSVKTDSIETAEMLIDAGVGTKAPYFHRSWILLPFETPDEELPPGEAPAGEGPAGEGPAGEAPTGEPVPEAADSG